MKSKKILIVDELHTVLVEKLTEAGFDVSYLPSISLESINQEIQDCQGLVFRSKVSINKTLLDNAPELKFVARGGAGIDKVDTEALKTRNIQLFRTPEGNRDAVAEHTIGMLLCLFNHLHLADTEVRQGVWNRKRHRGYEIKGKTVGIMGYGNMGRSLAQKLQSFDCRILAYDRYKSYKNLPYAEPVGLDTFCQETDILSLHFPLNEENVYFVNDDFLKHFIKPIYLINTARGKVLSLKAVKKGLQNGRILGACLDVLENERLDTLTPEQKNDFDYFKKSKNVLFSPHVAGWTYESYKRISEVLAEKIITFCKKLSYEV